MTLQKPAPHSPANEPPSAADSSRAAYPAGLDEPSNAASPSGPYDVSSLLQRAQAHCAGEQWTLALECCEAALKVEAGCADAQFSRGLALFMLDRLAEAERVMSALVEAHPTYPNAAWMLAGLTRRQLGDGHPATLSAYDAATETDPDNLYIALERADLLRSAGRYLEAREVYERMTSPDACDDEALRVEATFKLGCVALTLNDLCAARAAFTAVISAAPDYPDAAEMLELTETDG